MDRYLSKLRGILDLAESKNMTDRRKFLQELNEAYANEDCVKTINAQSAMDLNGVGSWNRIMLAIHRIALLFQEGGKPLGKNSRANSSTITQSSCSRLMLETVRLATNNADISLSCQDLIAMSLQMWGNKMYRIYHDTYIKILVHHVLTNETYRLEIIADQWREILRLSTKMYPESSDEFKSNLLDTMRLVVQYGCPQSHLTLDVRKILPFLEKVFREIDTGQEFMLKQLYKLTYTVCLEIGTESRIALCEFSENILPPIVSLEPCPEMYKLLLVFMKIHHPGGATVDDDGDNGAAYARDWNQWKNIIRGIYGNIVEVVKTQKLDPCFLELYCEVYRQISRDSTYLVESSPGLSVTHRDELPRKVRRLAVVVLKPVDMLSPKNDCRGTWPFVRILATLLKKYPDTVKSSDYSELVDNAEKLFAAALDDEILLGSLCELFKVLVENEKQHYSEAKHAKNDVTCWQRIWPTILRFTTLSKNEVSCHELLQSMIRHVDVPNPQEFLRLYLNSLIGWSSSSVETLLTFCTYSPIPEIRETSSSEYSKNANSNSSMRLSLLRWALEIPPSNFTNEIPVIALAKLLTGLAMKSRRFVNRDNRSTKPDFAIPKENLQNDLFDDRESKSLRNIETCNSTLLFRTNIFEDSEQKRRIDDADRMKKIDDTDQTKKTVDARTISDREIRKEVFEVLVDTLSDCLSQPVNDKIDINTRIIQMTVAARLMSNLADHEVPFDGQTISKLIRQFVETYKNIISIFTTIDKTSLSPSSHPIAEATEALQRLICGCYNRKVEKIIVQSSSLDFIEFMNDLVPGDVATICRFDDSRGRKSVSIKTDCTVACRVRNSADKIVVHHCCSSNFDESSTVRMTILKNVAKTMDNRRCSRNTCLRRWIEFLTVCSTFDEPSEIRDRLDSTIKFTMKLLKTRWNDERAVRAVLRILPRLMRATLSTSSTDGCDLLVAILSKINTWLSNETYGPLVHVEFVKCLSRFIVLNPNVKWKPNSVVESSQPIIQHLIKYIGNPFYVVRLEASRAFNVIFSLKRLNDRWKDESLKKIIVAATNLFETNPSADELTTRTITAIHVIAGIIRADDSRQSQSRAVLAMIDMSYENNVDAETIKHGLRLSWTKDRGNVDDWPRRLIEMNIREILSRWLEFDYPLDKFPWILVDCHCLKIFLRNYIDVLVTIKLQRLEFEHIKILCDNFEISFVRTMENCLPSIISLIAYMRIGESTRTINDESAMSYANRLHDRLIGNTNEFYEVKNFENLIDEKLSEIVVDIIERLHDQSDFDTIFETKVYLPNFANRHPTFDRNIVESCLRLLEEDLSLEPDTLVKHLIVRRPWILQKILMTLATNIRDVKSTDYEIQALYQYAYFCTRIMNHASKTYFDLVALYTIRDIAHTLLGLIKEETLLSRMACEFFEKFIDSSLPERANEMKEILSFVVTSLIPIVQSGKIVRAINPLRQLIIRHASSLTVAIEKLDEFPNERIFEDVKNVHDSLKYRNDDNCSLESVMEHFLKATDEKTLGCSVEGLVHLNYHLSTRRIELERLYEELEKSRGFAEDCASSTLHRSIYKLVGLTRSKNREVSTEAAKCLGQIGPADLTTLILHSDKSQIIDNRENDDFIVIVVKHLSEYIVDDDVDTKKSAADALYGIFSTVWSATLVDEFYTNNEQSQICGIKKFDFHHRVYPFLAISTCRSKILNDSTIIVDPKNLNHLLKRSDDIWIPENYDNHEKWIVDFIFRIIDCFTINFYAKFLKNVCERSIEFSEIILPRLVDLLIKSDVSVAEKFSISINRYFRHVYEKTRRIENFTIVSEPLRNNYGKKNVALGNYCIRSMLSIVKTMRINSVDNNCRLNLDYLSIANAADRSSAYFTSLFYAELSCRTIVQDSAFLREKLPGSWISAMDSICEIDSRSGIMLQHIVREACLHIDDPDSIYGCGLSHSIDSSFRAQHYTHVRRWDKVMLEQDIELNCSATASRRDMLNALRQSGHEYLLGVVMNEASDREADDVRDFMYEAAWRLADWNALGSQVDDDFSILQNYKSDDFHCSHYRALTHLRDGNGVALKNALGNARTSIVQTLREKTLECSQTLYPILSQLQMLREIEEFSNATTEPKTWEKLVNQWNEKDFSDTHDFRYVEPILSQRLTMCKMRKTESEIASTMDRVRIQTHLKMAEVAEKQGYLSMASRALDTLSEELDLSEDACHRLTYQKATLAWKEDERNIGRYFLKDLIRKPRLNPNLRAKALRICGNWMAESKCEKPRTIIKNYYEESIETNSKLDVRSSASLKDLAQARSDLGQFADAQYQQVVKFIKTTRYKNLEKCSRKETIDQQAAEDASQFDCIKRDEDTYLVLAVSNYLKTLETSNDHDLLIYRLVSLWFDNTSHDELNKLLQENLSKIGSDKFIPLLCQIAPHMSNVSNDFTDKIRNLMERCAMEHPHHTLPVLMALKNTHKDKDFEKSQRGARKNANPRPEARVEAATALVSHLVDTKIRPIIQEISQLSHALMMLAYCKISPADEQRPGPHKIPSNQPITKIRNFGHTIVPTITLNVNPSGNYDNIVSIHEYVNEFTLPGGVNKPKKLVCVGTDGIRRCQLVKGHDDLRQDAVMEQVFTVMNTMLKTSRETKRRRLHIRTYKIVPLSRRSGILEWCDNTIPICRILTDSGKNLGLHTKYYPNDWNTKTCRQKLNEVKSKSRSVKLATFLECCKNLHPAFHHFFMEKYPSAETWFERRLAYVRSVATTSMVGYILGLGDRHFSNILIDQTTAEVIHIDFGIAFAQGKILPIPETVPFRLTRDMEVAMGICGVEGVMRRSCEVTVAVLRERREILMTVLQVLLYDPLSSWAITPLNTNDPGSGSRLSRGLADHRDERTTNEIAEKALLRIDEKLQGTADGLTLSIPGQVERLIQQARDPANLCRLFCGWQPYL